MHRTVLVRHQERQRTATIPNSSGRLMEVPPASSIRVLKTSDDSNALATSTIDVEVASERSRPAGLPPSSLSRRGTKVLAVAPSGENKSSAITRMEFEFEKGPPLGIALADKADDIVIAEIVRGGLAHERGVPLGCAVKTLNGTRVDGIGAAAARAMMASFSGKPLNLVVTMGDHTGSGDEDVRVTSRVGDDDESERLSF